MPDNMGPDQSHIEVRSSSCSVLMLLVFLELQQCLANKVRAQDVQLLFASTCRVVHHATPSA